MKVTEEEHLSIINVLNISMLVCTSICSSLKEVLVEDSPVVLTQNSAHVCRKVTYRNTAVGINSRLD